MSKKSTNDLAYEALKAMSETGVGAKITINGQEYKASVHSRADLERSSNQSATAIPTASTFEGGANPQAAFANSRGQAESSVSTGGSAASGGTSTSSSATTASCDGNVKKEEEKKNKQSMLDV